LELKIQPFHGMVMRGRGTMLNREKTQGNKRTNQQLIQLVTSDVDNDLNYTNLFGNNDLVIITTGNIKVL